MFESITLEPLSPELLWILCLALVIAFLLAFSVGANDVSNSFGTSVGARVLTVTQACILATFFETAGATLLGYSVCDTFRRKMYDIKLYDGAQRELMLGALACLIGSAFWNIIATALKMPISGTHSIVGATIGFSVVLRGWDSIRWTDMLRIVASWFASPLLSGLISSVIYIIIAKVIIRKIDPLRVGLKALPLFYGATIFINVASIVIDGPKVFGLDKLTWYEGLFISLVFATIAITCVALILVPRLKGQILDELIARKLSRNSKKAAAVAAKSKMMHRPPPPTAKDSNGGVAYDNSTFKPDDQNDEKPASKMAHEAASPSPPIKSATPPPPSSGSGSGTAAATDGGQTRSRPHISPKPAHLVRQQPFEEVDLAPATIEKKQQQQQQQQDLDVELGDNGRQFQHESQQIIEGFGGERYEVARLFGSLQIMTACFASFAHGTNDVSNAVAPLIPIWNIYADGWEDISRQTPIWVLAFGSIGICTGLWAWGRAVMGTVSDGLTQITPSKGFSIELGAAISVLLATKLGLPISTTHCKIGSLVVVGLISGKFLAKDHLLSNMATSGGCDELEMTSSKSAVAAAGGGGDKKSTSSAANSKQDAGAVDLKLFMGIAATWIVTVPFAGLASAAVMFFLKWVAL